MIKRGYFVNEVDEWNSIGVIAGSIKEAKKLGFCELSCEWINMRCRWIKDADVKDLQIGIVEDYKIGLKHGLFERIEDRCDRCGQVDILTWEHRQALCFECSEKVYATQKANKQ